jgi:hypothetical protein
MSASLRQALAEAIRDFAEHGYRYPGQLSEWMQRLRVLARKDAPSAPALQERMEASLSAYYRRGVSYRLMRRNHPGVPRQTIQSIIPSLRPELTRRIMVSADLIKLNRDQAIEKTLQRFAGWASSIPEGGSRAVEKGETKDAILKSLRQLSYEERRITIDQGHKLISSVNAVIAQQTGAIAAVWRSHWRQAGYDFRKDHKERDHKIYLIRGNWAQEKGYLNVSAFAGYTDEITQPAEEVFCRCYYVHLRNLRDLPSECLTAKGREALEAVKLKAA